MQREFRRRNRARRLGMVRTRPIDVVRPLARPFLRRSRASRRRRPRADGRDTNEAQVPARNARAGELHIRALHPGFLHGREAVDTDPSAALNGLLTLEFSWFGAVRVAPARGLQRRGVCSGTSGSGAANQPTNTHMLHYAVVFFIVAIIAAILGFGGIAGTAAWIAQVLFVVFLVLFLVSLLTGRNPKV